MTKGVEQFVTEHNLKAVSIRYKHQFGYCKRRGVDIINPNTNEILISFEPSEGTGEVWHVRHAHSGYYGPRYLNKITYKFLKQYVDPIAKSFIHLKQ